MGRLASIDGRAILMVALLSMRDYKMKVGDKVRHRGNKKLIGIITRNTEGWVTIETCDGSAVVYGNETHFEKVLDNNQE